MKLQLLVLTLILPLAVFGQSKEVEKYTIQLKSGAYVPKEGVSTNDISKRSALRTDKFSGAYKLIQFYETPSNDLLEKVKHSGILLLEFIPNKAYMAYFSSDPSLLDYKKLKIRSIEDILPDYKIDQQLKNKTFPPHIIRNGGKVALMVKYFSNQSPASLIDQLKGLGCEVVKIMKDYNQMELNVPKSKIREIAQIESVSYIQAVHPPFTLNFITGVRHHDLNVLNSGLNTGRNLNGEGIVIGLGDGGYLDFHHDYQRRVKNLDNAYSSSNFHSVHVAGIIGGTGNINPDLKSGANKATLLNYSFQNVVLNAPSLYKNKGMVITNNSYGVEGYHGYYDYSSSLVDKQVVEFANVLHIFAAGNEYDSYAVSGGFNSAKNVLTVGSIDREDLIADYSSKGPVTDGRIKPEVVAVGSEVTSTFPGNGYEVLSGTSMSTPLVASAAALLYQRFQQVNHTLPDAGLIKAILCNTAEDLGNSGPDYSYGFGKINARRAVEAVEQKTYFVDSIKQSTIKTFSLSVPANTSQLKIMLYWNDKEASNLSAVSLVNDLDLELTSGGEKWNPWVLNPEQLNEAPVRSKDHLNNIEQITLNNPKAGTYSLKVNGFNIPFSQSQKFAVVYELIKPELILTHPLGGESFSPGDQVEIKWDNTSGQNLTVEFSKDGTSWQTLTSNYSTNICTYLWTVPDFVSKGMIRVKAGNYTSQCMPFQILGIPKDLNASVVSPHSVHLTWTKVKGATSYDVFLLSPEDMEMKMIGNTSGNVFSINGLDKSASYLFSVRARTTSLIGKRAGAVRVQLNDPVVSFINPSVNATYNSCEPVDLKIGLNDSTAMRAEFMINGARVSEDFTAPYEARLSYSPGIYEVSVQVTNEFGAIATSARSFEVKSPVATKMPFVLDFESDNGKWISSEDLNENIWKWGKPDGKIISSTSSGKSSWYTKVPQNVKAMKEYSLISPALNLKGIQGDVVLSFKQNLDLASKAEGVFMEMSTNCGQSWSSLGNRTSMGSNWYDSKLNYWNGDYFTNKDAWANETSGWREVKIVLPNQEITENDVQFKISYYLEDTLVHSEGIAFDDFKIDFLKDEKVNQKDSLALVAMYKSLNGDNWNLNANWLKGNVKD